jgi:16S rRNA (cytidine1402-2'-O)-methyltransferase
MSVPTLFLFPNLLSEEASHELYFPAGLEKVVQCIDGLIAESAKGGRSFLKRFAFPNRAFSDIPMQLLNEHTLEKDLSGLLSPILKGQKWGIVSDAGLTCIADPGAKLVYLARQKGVQIEVFSGPSSILFALLLSGLPAQSFSFHGYLEKDSSLLTKQLLKLQKRSQEEKSTQIFIETPYRNQKMLEHLLRTLHDNTVLCIAWDLTMPTQQVISQPIKQWKQGPLPDLNKKPAVFLFCQA